MGELDCAMALDGSNEEERIVAEGAGLFLVRAGVHYRCVSVGESDGAAALDGGKEEEGIAVEGAGLFLARAGICYRCVIVGELDGAVVLAGGGEEEEGIATECAEIWAQVQDVVVFAGLALRLWIYSPLMSLIDTMVISHTSSL